MRRRRSAILRLMILTLFVAVGIQGVQMARLSMRYAAKAQNHRQEASRSRAELTTLGPAERVEYMGADRKRFVEAYFRDSIRYHDTLDGKYQGASMRPWASVSEDPEAPDPFPSLLQLDEQPPFLATGGDPETLR